MRITCKIRWHLPSHSAVWRRCACRANALRHYRMRDRAAEPTGENRYTDACRDDVASEVTESLQMILHNCTTAGPCAMPTALAVQRGLTATVTC